MTKYPLVSLAVVMFVSTQNIVHAQITSGEMIVRVPDGVHGRCININTDTVSLTMRRIIVNKDEGYFKSDKEVGIKIDTTVSGGTKKLTFPRLFKTSINSFDAGHVSLPVEETLLNDLQLKQDKGDYIQRVEMVFTLLKKKRADKFGIAIETLAAISKNLPLPPNPYTAGFNFFADYANGVLADSLNKDNNVDTVLPSAKAIMSFAKKNDDCGDAERSGTLAVIQGESPDKTDVDGYVTINKLYCFKAELTPTFLLRFAMRPNKGNCDNLTNDDFKIVNNTYYAFFLNITEYTPTLLGFDASESDLQRLIREEALARCAKHGMDQRKCVKD